MCDCAETFHRKCCPRTEEEELSESRPPARPRRGPDAKKTALLALSALLCGLLAYMLYSLDRRTIKKLLTMLGLGFLFAQPTSTKPESDKPSSKPCIPKPSPCLKRPDPVEPKVMPVSPLPKDCTCNKKPTSCDKPPTPPPTCTLPKPVPQEKKCKCCPNN